MVEQISSREADTSSDRAPVLLRREQAAEYLRAKYGFGSPKTLAKLACVGGGPAFRKIGARMVVYSPQALDQWALSRLSKELRSTSDAA